MKRVLTGLCALIALTSLGVGGQEIVRQGIVAAGWATGTDDVVADAAVDGGASAAARAVAARPAAGCELRFSESGFSYTYWRQVPDADLEFKALPSGVDKESCIAFGLGPRTGACTAVLIDKKNCRLYVDANRNLDLSDDTAHQVVGKMKSTDQIEFMGLRMPIGEPSLDCRMNAYLNNYVGPGGRCEILLWVWSGWEGEIELAGGKRKVFFLETPEIYGENKQHLLLGAAGSELLSKEFFKHRYAIDIEKELVVDGHAYRIRKSVERKPDNTMALRLEFTESDAAWTELEVAGQHVNRIILQDDHYSVIIDRVPAVVRVPCATYSGTVFVDPGDSVRLFRGTTTTPIRVLPETPPARLTVGAPLSNTVEILGGGMITNIEYRLKDAAGINYERIKLDVTRLIPPPGIEIRQAGRVIAQDRFRYG